MPIPETMIEMLHSDLSDIGLPQYVKQPFIRSYNVEFNPNRFLRTLLTYKHIWVLTFTVDCNVANRLPVKRLLYTKMRGQLDKKIQARELGNNHAKMYLCFNSKLKDVFIGSFNLVVPTYLEILCKVDKEENESCLFYYENLWNQTK